MNCATRHVFRLGVGLLALALLTFAPPASANWLTRILKHADDVGPKRGSKRLSAIDEAGQHLKTLPASRRSRAVAAELTNEDHWRLRNAEGETFTAATPEELGRGLHVLAPLAEEAAKQVVLLTGDTVFKDAAKLKSLPADAELNALIGGRVYGLHRRVVNGVERYSLDVGGGVRVPIRSRAEVHEMLWQLARPVDLAEIRVLALEPGAAGLLKRKRPPDPAPGRIAVEPVDPDRLPHMLSAVARGTIVITGRVNGQTLHYKPSSGPERTLMLDRLRQAAAASDVDLVVIESASARQPGTRNWFWQRVALTSLDRPRTNPSLPDLIGQLTGGVPVETDAVVMSALRTTFQLTGLARGAAGGWTAPVSDTWRDLAPEVTGTIVASGLRLDLTSRSRQLELGARFVPGIPSLVQIAYVALLVLGLAGLGVARAWWLRIWPLEARSDYARRTGYWAARAVRTVVFLLIFMPLVAVVSAPVSFVLGAWRTVGAIGTILAYPFTCRRAA
ncbi:MAG: hypothetical protein ACK4TL_00935 [Hyphomicrobiaceae bacterium]